MGEDAVQAQKSSNDAGQNSVPETQELVVPSPSPVQPPVSNEVPYSSKLEGTQVHSVTILTLLDKLVSMLDSVQEKQQTMEQYQVDMESSVKGIQNDITKLSKAHTSTSNTVTKLLEKSLKVSVNMKEVRQHMEKQASQVKKLEENHNYLMNRNNFKVLIFQEQNEIPPTVFTKPPTPVPSIKEGEEGQQVGENKFREEILQTVDLSSDEEISHDDDELEEAFAEEKMEKSRAEKIKSSSLKKVDSIKKAFSRQNIEKKMNKISTKIVSPERREKIKKSLTPSQQKTSSTKSSKFKVSPITFGIKKSKGGVVQEEKAEQSIVLEEIQPSSPNDKATFEEVHSEMTPAEIVAQAVKAMAASLEREADEQNLIINNNNVNELSIVEDNEEVEMVMRNSGPVRYEVGEREEEEETALTATDEEEQPDEVVEKSVIHIEQTA